MAGLDPAIHVFPLYLASKTWIIGTSPVMTIVGDATACVTFDFRFNFQTATSIDARDCSRASREVSF
jgi:hypothetical protein